MAHAHVFVPDVDRPEMAAGDRHHLERVLRIRTGEEITVSDGRGRWRPCRFGSPQLVFDGDVVVEPAPSPPIAVAFALVKGGKPELVVQKLTELGVDRILPFTAARSVVRWSGPSHVERLRRVAREAAMQSRRVWLPEVEDLAAFAEVVRRPGAVMTDPSGAPPSLVPLVLVGPEGGWAEEEVAAADAHDVPRMRLGPHILRAETASVAVGALLAALRAGIVSSA